MTYEQFETQVIDALVADGFTVRQLAMGGTYAQIKDEFERGCPAQALINYVVSYGQRMKTR